MLNNNKTDARTCWELCKLEIKEKSIQYGIAKSRNKKNHISILEQKLRDKINNNIDDEESKIIEKELENEYTKKAIGAQIRSRIKWIEEGEKNTKYFLSLEKSRQTQKFITKIYDKEQKILSNKSDILERQKEFYEDLYKTKHPNTDQIKHFIQETVIESKLNSEDGDKCEGILTEDECYNISIV